MVRVVCVFVRVWVLVVVDVGEVEVVRVLVVFVWVVVVVVGEEVVEVEVEVEVDVVVGVEVAGVTELVLVELCKVDDDKTIDEVEYAVVNVVFEIELEVEGANEDVVKNDNEEVEVCNVGVAVVELDVE